MSALQLTFKYASRKSVVNYCLYIHTLGTQDSLKSD